MIRVFINLLKKKVLKSIRQIRVGKPGKNLINADLIYIGTKYMKFNPCLTCGACCAFNCVSFLKGETDHNVPIEMTGVLTKTHRFMKGTNSKNPFCIALKGKIGVKVECMIYENRPPCCRSFFRSWENGKGNSSCDKARSFYQLQPFSQY